VGGRGLRKEPRTAARETRTRGARAEDARAGLEAWRGLVDLRGGVE
jgi:hypothetical protein